MTSDPIRLFEDPSASSALRGDLTHATDVVVEGLDFAAGLTAVQSATTGAAGSSGAGMSMLGKLGIGVAVAGGLVALWLSLGSGDSPPATESIAAVTPVEIPEDTPTSAGGPGVRPAVMPAVVPETEPSSAEPSSAEPSPVPPAEPSPMQPGEPETEIATDMQPAADVDASASDESLGSNEPAAPRKHRAGKRPKTAEPTPPADDRSFLDEARLVSKARAQLKTNPARALSLAEQIEKEFPTGQLIEERRAITVLALVALGRDDEAQRRGAAFLDKYGRGAHAASVRRALSAE